MSGSQINVNRLADAIRNAAGNFAMYQHGDIGVTVEQARAVIGRFVDQLGGWVEIHQADAAVAAGKHESRFHVDQFLDACGFPRPAESRVMGGGYLDEAIALYRSGKTVSEVAKEMHMPRHILLYELKNAGMQLRGRPGSNEEM